MMTYASAFMLNIFSTFAIYRIFVRENYNFITEAVVQSSWNLYFYVYCFITITLCSLVTRTGKFSAILCHKAINYSHDDSIIDHVSSSEAHFLEKPKTSILLSILVEVLLSTNASSITSCFMWTFHVRLHFDVHGKSR